MPLLDIDHLNVKYGETQVLWDINLQVEKDTITAIFGPNGSGKSTLLHTISGLIRPFSGEIKYKSSNIVGEPTHEISRKGIVYVPEERWLFREMTVLENLEMGAYKEPKSSFDDKVKWVYELFPRLEERKNQIAGSLSGGEAKQLTIGRALMANPELIMLDEPALGIQPSIVSKIFDSISKIKEGGITVLLVEQKIMECIDIIDEFFILEDGRIVRHESEIGPETIDNIKRRYLGG